MSEHPAVAEPSQEPNLHVERWEGIWIRISVILLTIFVIAVTVAAVAYNIQVPGVGGRVDPNTLDAPGSPFANPGVRALAPGKFEVHVVEQAWAFNPNPIIVPQGAEVTFYVTSRDIQHGFKIVDTNINMMVLPGQISTLKAVFNTPGTHHIICHEYCGIAHHTMFGDLIVTPLGGLTETVTSTVESGITTGITGTVPATTTAALTGTAALTATDAVTASAPLTGAAETTATTAATATLPLTATDAVTAAEVLSRTQAVTTINSVTVTNGVSATEGLTATATVTP